MIESIYAEDQVVAEGARESAAPAKEAVECALKLQPNTGFNMEKIAVVIVARFVFTQDVSNLVTLDY
jgi:hypothetical protein